MYRYKTLFINNIIEIVNQYIGADLRREEKVEVKLNSFTIESKLHVNLVKRITSSETDRKRQQINLN